MTEPADLAAVWDDLKQLTRDVIEEMNRLEEFRNKTGGLDYQLGETDSIIVTKQSHPSMSVTISCRSDALEIAGRIAARGAKPIESQESLVLENRESGPSFRTETGEVLTIEETVYYILRPFLHLNGVASLAAAQQQ
ncbi:MAG TPA: hypothetical protein VGD38_12205 [Pyrinomonadaceae bacterium]